jgi:hypothetical protein
MNIRPHSAAAQLYYLVIIGIHPLVYVFTFIIRLHLFYFILNPFFPNIYTVFDYFKNL